MENDEIKYKKDIPLEWLKMPSSAKEAEKLNIKKYFNGLICRKGSHYSPLYQSNGQGKGCVMCNSIRSKEKTKLKNEKLGIEPYTLESFIREANEVHNGYYSYDLINSFRFKKDYYLINCPEPEHKPFRQRGTKHLRGQGCKLCNQKKWSSKQVLPFDKFIERCKKIHNERYDLSRIAYRNLHDKIKVGCKIEGHGFFETEANNFMRGLSNCKLCSAKETSIRCRKTTEEFIKKAKRKHKDNYDYSLVNYITSKTNILIKCKKPDHGIFPQLPHTHLNGVGCPKCAKELTAKKLSLTMDEFLRRAKEKHGDLYDYSKVKLSKKSPSHSPVQIICRVHKEFNQTPSVHFRSGCRKCHMEYLWNELRPIGKEEWMRKSQEQHSNKYSYELVKDFSKVTQSKVKITCPLHGPFEQQARDHMNGRGCQKCGDINRGRDSYNTFKSDNLWASIPTDFYFVEVDNSYLKFGITVDFEDRSRARYTDCFYRIELDRASAWTLEQYMYLVTSWATPSSLPDSLASWGGNTELRTKELPILEIIENLDNLISILEQKGWEVFFENYVLSNSLLSSLPLNQKIGLSK